VMATTPGASASDEQPTDNLTAVLAKLSGMQAAHDGQVAALTTRLGTMAEGMEAMRAEMRLLRLPEPPRPADPQIAALTAEVIAAARTEAQRHRGPEQVREGERRDGHDRKDSGIGKPPWWNPEARTMTIRAWLAHADNYLHGLGTTDPMLQTRQGGTRLEGSAATLFARALTDQTPWPAFKDQLLRAYASSADMFLRLDEMGRTKQENTPLAAYAARWRNLAAETTNIAPEVLVFHFCRGLDEWVHCGMNFAYPATLEEAITHASTVVARKATRASHTAYTAPGTLAPAVAAALRGTPGRGWSGGRSGGGRGPLVPEDIWRERLAAGECGKCGRNDHRAGTCRNPRRLDRLPRGAPRYAQRLNAV
ncbi:MAG: hypothetical protein ACRDL7_12950, partial [Gaiellaceae bacterium]